MIEYSAATPDPQVRHALEWTEKLLQDRELPFRIRLEYDASVGTDGVFRLQKQDELVTIGGDAEGLRCGLYTLLHAMGFRWFNPGEPVIGPAGEIRPDWENLTGVRRPDFKYRGLHICGPKNHFDEKVAAWMSFNRMNRKLTSFREIGAVGDQLDKFGIRADTTVHAYATLVPDRKYFAEHPEYFALVGGRRIRQREGGQLCLSNPSMRRVFTEELSAMIRANPRAGVYGICPNDGYGWCECENCRSLDTPADREKKNVNGRVADFTADICRRIYRTAPEAVIGHYSYSNFADFMELLPEPPPNLMISFTQFHCFRHPLGSASCPVNSRLAGRLKKITEKVKHVYLYDYYNHNWSGMPAPFWAVQCMDFRQWKEAGIDGFLSEAPGADSEVWDSFWPAFYLAARLLWDSGLDAEDFIRDFCRIRYGGAAGLMERYFKMLSAAFLRNDRCFKKVPEDFEEFFTEDLQEKCSALLAQAAPQNHLAAAEQRQFDKWREIYRLRDRYRSDKVIVPGEPYRVFLVDAASQLPNTENDTEVRISGDTEKIRFRLVMHEKQMDKLAVAESVYGGDCLEIFLSDGENPEKCYHFLIAPDGKTIASECEGSRWNWSWEHHADIKVVREAECWRIDLALDRKVINAGNEWGFSIIRNRYAGGKWEVLGAPAGGAFFRPAGYIRVKTW